MALTLRFATSDVDGHGEDLIGPFEIGGVHSEQSKQVQFVKSYTSFAVFYSGLWDGDMIAGLWTVRHGSYLESGEFEIWPNTGSDQAIESLFEELVRTNS